MEDQYLPFFITEDVFILNEPNESASASGIITEKTARKETKTEVVEEPSAIPPTPLEIHELAIWTPPLTKADRELLTNILKAIKKDFSTIFLMEGINSYQPNYHQLLCFGYHQELELKLGSRIDMYQPVTAANQKVLASVAPENLQTDKNQKALLWEALQKMFLK